VISAERELLMSNPPHDGVSPLVSTGILAAFCAVSFTSGLYLFNRSLNLARRLGILSV
jgi:ABC-2 type transport system permease protein